MNEENNKSRYKKGDKTKAGYTISEVLRSSPKSIIFRDSKGEIYYEYDEDVTNVPQIESMFRDFKNQINTYYPKAIRDEHQEALSKVLGMAFDDSENDWKKHFDSFKENIQKAKEHYFLEMKLPIYMKFMTLFIFIVGLIFLIILIGSNLITVNSKVFLLDKENIILIAHTFNAMVGMTITFLFGIFGAITRILISNIRIVDSVKIILGSGMMSIVSWFTIKSGILIIFLGGQIKDVDITNMATKIETTKDFYMMGLVAIIVGMFSSTIYLAMYEKIENILSKQIKDENKN